MGSNPTYSTTLVFVDRKNHNGIGKKGMRIFKQTTLEFAEKLSCQSLNSCKMSESKEKIQKYVAPFAFHLSDMTKYFLWGIFSP